MCTALHTPHPVHTSLLRPEVLISVAAKIRDNLLKTYKGYIFPETFSILFWLCLGLGKHLCCIVSLKGGLAVFMFNFLESMFTRLVVFSL